MPGKLYLLPNLLEEDLPIEPFFPITLKQAVESLDGIIAESEKMARRYLRKFVSHEAMAKCPIALLNEHVKEVKELLEPIERGETWGLISDAGLPCIADPGADLVWLAQQKKIDVQTFVGPSSIIMALQLSGLSAQNFSFHGYLPREGDLLEKKVRELEKTPGTHLWIEAPYRSAKMLDLLKRVLQPKTKLAVAASLTTDRQKVLTQTVDKWKGFSLTLGKEPAVFLISS